MVAKWLIGVADASFAAILRYESGGPAGIRTLDTRIKSPLLYQAELPAPDRGYAGLTFSCRSSPSIKPVGAIVS